MCVIAQNMVRFFLLLSTLHRFLKEVTKYYFTLAAKWGEMAVTASIVRL